MRASGNITRRKGRSSVARPRDVREALMAIERPQHVGIWGSHKHTQVRPERGKNNTAFDFFFCFISQQIICHVRKNKGQKNNSCLQHSNTPTVNNLNTMI